MELRRTLNTQITNARGIILLVLEIHYRALVTIATCYLHKYCCGVQWNKTVYPNMDTQTFRHLTFDKCGETCKMKNKRRELDVHIQKNTLDMYQSPYPNTNFKWIKDLNLKFETLKM